VCCVAGSGTMPRTWKWLIANEAQTEGAET
jgi:hypothetical protein